MEALKPFLSKFRNAVLSLLVSLLTLRVRLAVEFVSIADEFLLKRLRKKVMVWQWQTLSDNFLFGKSGSGMSLADAGVAWKAFRAHDLSTYYSVADIRFGAIAFYPRRITPEDANVVEHCSLYDELPVECQFGMGVANLHGTFHDQRAVCDENPAELVVVRVVFVYY